MFKYSFQEVVIEVKWLFDIAPRVFESITIIKVLMQTVCKQDLKRNKRFTVTFYFAVTYTVHHRIQT